MTRYRDNLLDYFRSVDRAVVPGLLVCVVVTPILSFLVTWGTVWDGGFALLPPDIFVESLVFSLLTKVGPIVLALVICLCTNSPYLMPAARMRASIFSALRSF